MPTWAPRRKHLAERTQTISDHLAKRNDVIERLRQNPDVAVLVVGAGINGAAVFRELALHDVDAVIVDRGDFSCGTSAGPSRMVHAGIRYTEFGERKLVQEGVHERNLLLQNAPHYIFPLPTTIPLHSRLSGMWGVIMKTLGLPPGKRPTYRGAWMVKIGLKMYDRFAEHNRQMPKHYFTSKADAFKRRPALHPSTIGTATYYDGWVSYPERVCMDLICDAEAMSENARALNYVSVRGTADDAVTLRDELTGEELTVRPKAVVNATGAWIDFANDCLGHESKLIAGTKGGHLVLDNDEMLKALDGEMLFYETPEGRAVVALPWLGKPLIGSTDISVDDPDTVRCEDDEIDYIIDCVKHVLPNVTIDRSQILSTFSGVRPLRAASAATTGQMSRSHYCDVAEAKPGANFPVYSMVGGKWTPFRAFGEQTMDKLLDRFNMTRKGNTESMPIGGGRDFPRTDAARAEWIARVSESTGLDAKRVDTLLFRYGTHAEQVAAFCTAEPDRPLQHHDSYTAREIEYIILNERVCHLDDLVLRRTAIALLGELQANPGLLDELLALVATAHEWSPEQTAADRARTVETLRTRHGINLE